VNRCAVVIGVNKTGDMPVLQAAVSGAKEFANWANSQGIEVVLLTDSHRSGVSLSEVKKAIHNFVQKKTFSQLIVFFSGHGILKAPDFELWLLSGAPDDANDAVNVPGSIWLARNAGIPHVVLISDACRSRPNTPRLSQIEGGVIFPNYSPRKPRPAVDVFYATLPGDPAFEASTPDAVKGYRGIFTECLLKGLKGEVPDVIIDIGDKHLNQTRWVIPSWELKPYLEEEVPEIASSINIKLQQDPDIRVESHLPYFLAEVAPRTTHSVPQTQSQSRTHSVSFRDVIRSLETDMYFQDDVAYSSLPHDISEVAQNSDFAHAMNRLRDPKGRESLNTRTGFTVVGTIPTRAVVTGSDCDLFEDSGVYQIRVHERQDMASTQSLLVQFSDGQGIPLAVLPGFIGTIFVEHGRVVNVTYLPSRDTPKFFQYKQVAKEIEKRRAYVAVAARNGSFRLEGREEALSAADFLRVMKSIDPTLGLYASYAYAQAGDFNGIKSVYKYMGREKEPILFDVAVLANKLPKPKLFSKHQHPIAPFCPMLTQGWALLKPYQRRLPAAVNKAGRYLVPGLWTTFEPEGVEILRIAIDKEEFA
jgi:hypothetical protein